MIKKYIGITLITASMLAMGCSSSDDDDTGTTAGETTDGGTTDGTTAGGTTDGTTAGGTTDGTTAGGTTDGTTAGGTTDGTTAGGTTDGTTAGGTTDGTTAGGTTDGTTAGGTTDGGTTDGTTAGGTTDGGTTDGDGANSIVEALGAAGFGSLVNSLARASLTDTVAGDNNGDGWTIFAPSDAAIAAADFPSMSEADLNAVLQNHLVSGMVTLADGASLSSTSNLALSITTDGDAGSGFAVNGNPIATGVAADNGTIYGIEAVLTAP